MPHSLQSSLDSKRSTPEPARPMTSNAATFQAKPTGTPTAGTALSSRGSRSDLPSQNPNAWKRASSPIAEAYADFVGRGGNIDEVLTTRKAGDRTSMGQYNNASKHRSQYYEDQFRYKDNEAGTIRERVQRESPVIAELRTNVIIKDEFTLVTDLSYHLAQRYTRPDSSIMIKVDHSACLALGGTFDPCYILTVTALPSQMGPTVNKRNAALMQSFMADILSVPSDRGIVKFQPIDECNYAMNGTTMLGEIERLEKHQGDDGVGSAMRRAVTNASRKSIPAFQKKSMPTLDTNVKSPTTDGARTPTAAPTTNGVTPIDKKRRSTTATPPLESALPNVFELAATESNERPSTAHGPYAAENGLRMNGISKEDLLASQAKGPGERPKTIAGQSPVRSPIAKDQSKNEPMPPVQRRPSQHRQSSHRKSMQPEAAKKPGNIPVSPKPAAVERRQSSTISPTPSKAENKPALPKKDIYLDNVTTTNTATNTQPQRPPTATATAAKVDPKLDAKAAEKNRQLESSKDTTANTAKRRSTVTATPKIPPPPPVPETKSRQVPSKRKSFLSAFRRSTAA